MRSFINYFIKYPISGNVLMVLIFFFGAIGLTKLRATFFPQSESRIILIQAFYPGASPEEIEEGIVMKIEDNLKGLTGLERVSSVSSENAATVTVEVVKGFDTDLVMQDVKNAVDRISAFPVGMEPPVIFKRENLNLTISFAMSGEVDLRTLKRYARTIEDDLMRTEGISKIEIKGFPDEEIQIAFREDDLRAYDLSFEQAALAVRRANVEITGGAIKNNSEELLIRAKGKHYYAADMQGIVVKTSPGGGLVLLQDIANVTDQWADVPDRDYLDAMPAVSVTVNNTVEEDILFIADHVNEYIEQFNEKQDKLHAVIVRDGSIALNQRIALLQFNGLIGFALVLIFLALFLNIRLAFWVAISIPISFMGMFIIAAFHGLTINVISLFGMILVIGILVDDGIVIGENVFSHYEQGKSRFKAALDGTMEVLPAVTSAVLTTIVAFASFFFLDGRLGEFAPDLAFVVIFTLAFSLLEGAFILPGHIGHSKALKGERKLNAFERKMEGVMNFMRHKLYGPLLRFCLNNKALAMSIAFSVLILTIASIGGGIIGTTFFPFIERDNIDVEISMPPGTRDNITLQRLTQVEEAVWQVNETFKSKRPDGKDVVLHVQKKLGPEAHKGTVSIILLDGETRDMSSFIISNAIRNNTGPIVGAEKVSFGIATPFGKPISISLRSHNLSELNAAKEALKEELNHLTTLKDILDNDQAGNREINIQLKDKAKSLGLTLSDVIGQVRQGFFGFEVQRLQRGVDEVKVWVRYSEQNRSSIADLQEIWIRTLDGRKFPFREVATYEIERGVIAINHLDGEREIRVEADVSSPEVSASDVMGEIEGTILPPVMQRYPSVSYSFEGQSREAAKSQKSMRTVMPIILVVMIAIVTLTFRSFPQAFLVFLTIPFGVIGVGWGHWLHNASISMLSGFGIIALIGIMVNDALVFVSAFNNLMREGRKFMDAIYEAGISRFRPILLTSVTTIAGLGPLMLEKSLQAKFLIPMAIAVAYGLLIATLITLVILPVMLVTLNSIRVYLIWLYTGRKPTREEVEPAFRETIHEEEI